MKNITQLNSQVQNFILYSKSPQINIITTQKKGKGEGDSKDFRDQRLTSI